MSDKIVNVYVGECFQEGAQVGGEGKTYGLTLTGNKLKLVENGQQSEVDLPSGGGEISNAIIDKVNAFMDGLFEVRLNPQEIYYGGNNKIYPLIITGNGDDVPLMLNFYGDLAGDLDTVVLGSFFNTSSSPVTSSNIFHLFDPSTHDFFYKGTKLSIDNGGDIETSGIPKGLPFVQIEAKPKG